MNWAQLNQMIERCRRCPRLRDWCATVAREKRRAFADWNYWGRPVPNFGDPRGRLLIVGLAPAAHGANRTGRMFTGDRSGQWLFGALYETGFANQPTFEQRDDGLELVGCVITAACHCAPPGNRPTIEELDHCRDWLTKTIDFVPARVFVALGQIAWRALVLEFRRRDWLLGPTPRFRHASLVELSDGRRLLGSYHPSQQNTFTGKLTMPMLVDIFRKARELLDVS
jgi:uracil-DNA glycosylase family 4